MSTILITGSHGSLRVHRASGRVISANQCLCAADYGITHMED